MLFLIITVEYTTEDVFKSFVSLVECLLSMLLALTLCARALASCSCVLGVDVVRVAVDMATAVSPMRGC
jgi:hypothetical protein